MNAGTRSVIITANAVSFAEILPMLRLTGSCPFCGHVPTIRWGDDTWWLENRCPHLVLVGGMMDVSPQYALTSIRSWNAPEGHPWPWQDGWPVSGIAVVSNYIIALGDTIRYFGNTEGREAEVMRVAAEAAEAAGGLPVVDTRCGRVEVIPPAQPGGTDN